MSGITSGGTVETIHDLPTYVKRPESEPTGVVVIITDIFGWELANSRLLADFYAKEGGYIVYVPDFMNGNIPNSSAMHAMESLLAPSPSIFTTIFYKPFWALRVLMAAIPFLLTNREKEVLPKILSFHQALRDSTTLPIASAGFCWGGKYTILLAQRTEPALIDCAFTAHPSKMNFPHEYKKVKIPLSIAIGDVDMGIPIEMVKKIKGLLEEMEGNEVVVYEGAKHGFAVRADPNDKGQVKSAGEARAQALKWFGRWLSS
ncbi:hypothetical protein HYALB_00012758 [Hymenoscyphus albidus]|uniref:Dienelactone hydrolase domain-containing protein n=1 Tax=Hymenoscyphus albidus TaxID=595503 RepID=A0A9N9QA47_9HELO|nr:hypothetical protein HYALB_00012758 [Hymenoscyphus albidus]